MISVLNRINKNLRDIILGGQDGLVNVLGLTLGLFAAQADGRVIIIAGLAAGLSESISMGAVAYTSSLADKDYYSKSKNILLSLYEKDPKLLKDRVIKIFEEKSFQEEELRNIIVNQILKNKEITVDLILAEELKLQPIETKGLVFSSFVVTISALIGSIIPLVPFMFIDRNINLQLSIIISAIVLFFIGAYKAITLVGSWWKEGLKMLLIGMISAFAGFLIGLVLKV